MKSVDEVQKMKVAELKQELTSRGLDAKGVKAVLVDRLLDAMVKEGGDFGNGTASLRSTILEDSTAGSGEEEDDASQDMESSSGQDSPKRATRGQSQPASPVKAVPLAAKSPTPVISHQCTAVSPKISTSPVKTIPAPQTSPSSNKLSVSPPKLGPSSATPSKLPTTAAPVSTTIVSPTPVSPKKAGLTPNLLVKPDSVSPTKQPTPTSESMKASVTPEISEPQPTQLPESNCVKVKDIIEKTTEVEMIQPAEILSTTEEEPGTAEDGNHEQSKEPSQGIHDEGNDDKDIEMTEDFGVGGEEAKTEENDEELIESEESETLKRKHVEEPAGDEHGDEKSDEQPKKVKFDHYTVRILPEDEPDFDDEQVLLDWYKSDLNMGISKEDFLKATPVVYDEFPWAYAGVKATHGFANGKFAYEVKWVDNLNVRIDFGTVEQKHVLRVGWSELYADMQLGEDKFSYGFDSEGKFYNAGEMQVLEDSSFQKGDVISTFLDLESDPVEIKFAKNGTELVQAIQIPKSDLEGKVFFPHVLARNTSFEVNFGGSEPKSPLPEHFEFVGKVEGTESNKVRGPRAPKLKADCEFVMLCGMACCGKTKWAKDHKASNLDSHFNIIGTSSVVERAVKKATLGGEKTPRVYDSFLMKAGRFVEKMVELAPTRRRNYILDQSNVMPVVQRRKAAGFEGFKRRAVVILPNDEEYQKRIQAREQEQGKSVPKSTLLDMKATFRLPEVGEIFSEVDFPELKKEECAELLKKYNKEGADAGFFGQKPSRGGWYGGPGGFSGRAGRGFRGGGGFRGPRRGGSGFRGGPPPFRFMRGDARPPRFAGPGRVSRDFSPRSFHPRGRGAPPPLIPRRSEPPRSAWIRGVPPMNGRGGGSPSPRMYHSSPRPGSGYGGGRGGYGGSPMGNPRTSQQSIWTSGQPGGGWGHSGRGGGFQPQHQQHPDPWVQQVPDQGYGQSWGASGRGGGGGTWQGYGGQTYGSYGR